ncbi:MAG: translocation and assembly module TamB, partial [Acidobacteriota bacterium]|nr:translocation and assembly module TamB [Acidobacteriota bacterium]
AQGIPARATIDPRRALAYRWTVSEAGRYTVVAWGLRNPFAVRLEDADGWPVAAPLASGELAVDLEPGVYRLIVLPQAVPARAVVLASQVRAPRELSGHGPHALALDTEEANLWLEPAGEAPRDPDRWRFTLPARTGVTVSLSDEMMGEIRSLSADAALPDAGLVPPGRSFRGELAAGEYELAAESSRSNNRLRYRVAVRTDDLVDGGVRQVVAPGEITLAVGGAGEGAQVELASFGRSDVRATLMTDVGEAIAAADDRPGDWNFLISERLGAGRYRLRVDPVGSAAGSTTVAMRVLRERTAEPIAASPAAARQRFELGEEAVLVPLTQTTGAEILAAGALAGESLGLALEERNPASAEGSSAPADPSAPSDTWRVLASAAGRSARLALPLAESTAELRLRIWSLDRRPATVELTVFAGTVAHRSEAELARGFELTPLPGVEPGIAAAIVDLKEPGCFRREGTDGAESHLLQALAAGSTFGRAAPTLAPVGFAMPLAVLLEEGQTVRVQARRAYVGEGEALALALPPGTPITCDVADGGAAVVELEATAGEPVVGFLDGRGTVGPSTAWGPTGSGRVRSAKSAGRGRAVELWNSGASTVEARLSGWLTATAATAASATDERLGWGAGRASARAREARFLELPAGEKDLRLTLSPGTSVLTLAPANAPGSSGADDDAEALAWAPIDATTETLVTRSNRLLLFGAEGAPGEVSLELLPRSAGAGSSATAARLLSDQQRLEMRFSSTGAFRVPVSPAAPGSLRSLHLRGAGAAILVGDDGRVQRGTDFELTSAGGSLRFAHPRGLVSAWIDSADAVDLSSSAGVEESEPARSLTLPATVELSGAKESLAIDVAAPSLLKLRGSGAVAVSAGAVGSPAVRAEVYPQGAHFDAVLPAGRSVIAIRGLAGENLTGSVSLVAETLTPLGEGLGEESLLAPGDSRGYSFRVARPGPVGVGVRADQGDVETVLADAAGRILGKGVVQWASLEAGDYVLVVAAPAEGRPARVRPALVGATPPGSGPPPEEARRFLALAAGEAPA